MNGSDIHPVVLIKDLQAANLVLKKDGDARRVGVPLSRKGQMRLGARWAIVWNHTNAFKAFRFLKPMPGKA